MKNMKYGCMRAWIDTEKLPSLKERKISTNAALLVFCFLQIWWLWLRFGSKNSTAGEIIKLLTELLLLILLQSSPHWTMKKHKSTAPTMLWDMRRFYGENYKHPFHSSAKFYFSFINFVWKTENWGGGEEFKTQIFTQLSQIFIYQNVEQSNILHFCFHG